MSTDESDPPQSATKLTVREQAPYWAGLLLAGAAFPRVVYFKGWLRGRALLTSIVLDTAFRFAVLHWVRPWAARQTARMNTARAELTTELGREPTHEELAAKLGYSDPDL